MVNINCPTATYKILSYIFPLPSKENFDMFNFMDKLEKARSSGLFFNQNVSSFPMKGMLSPIVVLHLEHYQ